MFCCYGDYDGITSEYLKYSLTEGIKPYFNTNFFSDGIDFIPQMTAHPKQHKNM